MYSLIQPATKSTPVYLNATNNEPLRIESALICQDTGEGLWPMHGCASWHEASTLPC
jgi:hypothetical protein